MPKIFHPRKSIRLPGFDYTSPGAYFVTIVTHERACLFGKVNNTGLHLNDWGRVADYEWKRLSRRFQYLELDSWVIMPNHIHGIIQIKTETKNIDLAANRSGIDHQPHPEDIISSPNPGVAPRSLGAIIRAYKSTVAVRVNALRKSPGAPLWQRNYYEHIICNEADWKIHRGYTAENPFRWEMDDNYEKVHHE